MKNKSKLFSVFTAVAFMMSLLTAMPANAVCKTNYTLTEQNVSMHSFIPEVSNFSCEHDNDADENDPHDTYGRSC